MVVKSYEWMLNERCDKMNEEKINKFIEDEVDDVLDIQFIDGERFFGLAYKHEGGLLVFDKTQQIIADWDWWDVVPMADEQVVKLLNDLYTECESLKRKNKQLVRERNMKLDNALSNVRDNVFSFHELIEAMKQDYDPSEEYKE